MEEYSDDRCSSTAQRSLRDMSFWSLHGMCSMVEQRVYLVNWLAQILTRKIINMILYQFDALFVISIARKQVPR